MTKIEIREDDFTPDLYFRLGVEQDVNAVDLLKAYKTRAKETHPDLNPGNPNATVEFVAVGRAYEVLKDPVARPQYDRMLAERTPRTRPRPRRAAHKAASSTFSDFNIYKDFRYTPDDLQKYKNEYDRYRQAKNRLASSRAQSGDASTVFNFGASGRRGEVEERLGMHRDR